MALPDDFRAQSRANWGERAEGWEAHRDPWRSATMPVSAWMIDALDPQPGQNLLELAAGTGDTGLLAAELIAPTGELICSDFSPEMLAVARRRAEELGVTNVRFKQIDADTSIDVPAASRHGVLCRWGYMLLADPGNALRETRRVLVPGGRAALAAWAAAEHNPFSVVPLQEAEALGLAEPVEPGRPGQFAWADPERIAAELEDAGFTEHQIEALDFGVPFRDAAGWLEIQAAFSGRLTAARRAASAEQEAALLAALERRAADYAVEDGTLLLPARTWVAWAES
jgi:ubiquinone/menaquinone biosynthesis C-methylase UbiE